MPRTQSRATLLLAAAFALFAAPALQAQSAPITEEPGYVPFLTFDVATIRPVQPSEGNIRVSVSSPPHSSRFEVSSLPMKGILQIAYGFDAPFVNLPDWAENTMYNLQARSDEAADARLAKLTDNEVRIEKRNAIRVLLADRLELKTHMETRNSAIYNLTIAKGGLKMTAVPKPEGDAPATPPPADVQAHGSRQGLEFVGTNAPLRAICGALSSQVQAPVADKTGLTGLYNYTVQFGREWSANNPEGWPSIFTAVQEQMGLKLESVHEPVPNLIIDHITKPTGN